MEALLHPSILTAPLLDGKLLGLGGPWAAWSAAVSEQRQARESTLRRLDGQCSFSSNRLRPSYAMSSRRREGGWRRNPMAWPRSSVEDLEKRRVDQYKRMQLNPGATLAIVTICSAQPTSYYPTTTLYDISSHAASRSSARDLHATIKIFS